MKFCGATQLTACALGLTLAAAPAFAEYWREKTASPIIPLPPRRPPELAPRAPEAPAPKPQPSTPNADATTPNCSARLRDAGIVVEQAVAPSATLPDCSVTDPVRLISIETANGRIDFPAKPLVGCVYAETFGQFMRDLVAPLGAGVLNTRLIAVDTGPGYECRGRNGNANGKTSAHGKGLAMDVASFSFSDGRRVGIEKQDGAAASAFVNTLRRSACGWFLTVLGPGSDDHHANHIHLDTEPHGSNGGYRICQ